MSLTKVDRDMTNISDFAPVDSPVFTGTPTSPAAGASTDTGQIATMQDVHDVVESPVYNNIKLLSQVYSSHGSYTFTVPSGVTNVKVTIIGAGGGGARVTNLSHGGGAGGATAIIWKEVTPGSSHTVVVGEGGSGRSSYNQIGENGGNSSFDTSVSVGGDGGKYNLNESSVATGGTTSVGSGLLKAISIRGSTNYTYIGGCSSIAGINSTQGYDGWNIGGGGNGGTSSGGDGRDGMVVVEWTSP